MQKCYWINFSKVFCIMIMKKRNLKDNSKMENMMEYVKLLNKFIENIINFTKVIYIIRMEKSGTEENF